jgi:uncharacterized protein YjbJ (UPF0337 family)
MAAKSLERTTHMNWDQIEGKWKQLTGSARERWGKLTDDDVQALTGQKDHLVGKIQERYGIASSADHRKAVHCAGGTGILIDNGAHLTYHS